MVRLSHIQSVDTGSEDFIRGSLTDNAVKEIPDSFAHLPQVSHAVFKSVVLLSIDGIRKILQAFDLSAEQFHVHQVKGVILNCDAVHDVSFHSESSFNLSSYQTLFQVYSAGAAVAMISMSISAVEPASPDPSELTMIDAVPFSPLPVSREKYT